MAPQKGDEHARSRVRLLEDEHADKIEEAPPANTKIEVEGQQPLPIHDGG